jgi:hypothetical protein
LLLVDFHESDAVTVLGECLPEGQRLSDHFERLGNASAFICEKEIALDECSASHFRRDPHCRRAEVAASESLQGM